MLAIDVRHFELGIVTALTGLALAAMPASTPISAPVAPEPAPEPIGIRLTETARVDCSADGISAVVFRGRIHALASDQMATFHFRFADLPSRYMVMTGSEGVFEIRVPRAELGIVDLCSLPSSGVRPAKFEDAQMSIEYELTFER